MHTEATGIRWAALVWLAARTGRTDRVRISATAVVSGVTTVFALAAVAVINIGGNDGPYSSDLLMQPGLRVGVALGLIVFVALLLVLTAQCARIGAPARDRRFATYRLAGATPYDVTRIAGVETALASGLGAALGALTFLIGKPLLNGLTTEFGSYTRERPLSRDTVVFEKVHGQLHLLPTDVHVAWWAVVVAVIGLTMIVGAVTQLAMRRVRIGPFGVARRASQRIPRKTPALMFVIGTVFLALFSPLRAALGMEADASRLLVVFVVLATVVTSVGLLWGTAALAQMIGQWAAARTSRASVLIAGRRLAASPFTASRTNSIILLVALVGGFIQGLRAYLMAVTSSAQDPFYATTMNFVNTALGVAVVLAAVGVLVNTGETIVTARQTLSGLVAGGVPRGVLRRGLLLEALLPLLPTIPLAALAGVLASRGVFGTEHGESLGTVAHERVVIHVVPIPWVQLAMLSVGTLLAAALMAWIALLFVNASTDPGELRTTA
ncbi:MAG: hypothetical protein L0H93_06535 [Nocardioides sp.]|nr:hypothetical protein [Nocardioides sp.]